MNTTTRHLATLLLAVAVAATTTGCGADNSRVPNPCTLLTEAQIEEATGIDFGGAEYDDDLSSETQRLCVWHSEGEQMTFVQVLVSEGAAQVTAQRAEAEDYLGSSEDLTVAGATDAYSLDGGSIVGMAVDDYFVQVSAITSFDFNPDEVTAVLAPLLVTELKAAGVSD